MRAKFKKKQNITNWIWKMKLKGNQDFTKGIKKTRIVFDI